MEYFKQKIKAGEVGSVFNQNLPHFFWQPHQAAGGKVCSGDDRLRRNRRWGHGRHSGQKDPAETGTAESCASAKRDPRSGRCAGYPLRTESAAPVPGVFERIKQENLRTEARCDP